MKRWQPFIAISAILCISTNAIGNPVGEKGCVQKTVPLRGQLSSNETLKPGSIRPKSIDDICVTPECVRIASRILDNMDTSVNPCDNFYQFACRGFINSTKIPDDATSVSATTSAEDALNEQLRTIMEENSDSSEIRPFKMVKTLYKSCMNRTALKAQGVKPLLNILKKLGGWPVLDGDSWNETSFDWIESMNDFRDVGLNEQPFLDFDVRPDSKNVTRNIIYLDEPKSRFISDYLSEGFENKIVNAYYRFMVDTAVILGANKERALSELEEVMLFKIELNNITTPKAKASQVLTMNELTANYSSVPWRKYFTGQLSPSNVNVQDNEVVIVSEPNYIKKLEKLMSTTPKRVQANYALWRATTFSLEYIVNENYQEKQRVLTELLFGVKKSIPRWETCVNEVKSDLHLSVGAMFVRRYSNPEIKEKATSIIVDIKKQLDTILQKVEWLDDETRQLAREKLNEMSANVAYSEELLLDYRLEEYYETLELSEANYLESVLNTFQLKINYGYSQLREFVRNDDWTFLTPALINAFYLLNKNRINVPAGILLQKAFFNNDGPKYVNYASMGEIVGHEITHGFDDRGSRWDKYGNLKDWWSPEAKAKLAKRSECIINQYENYTVKEVETNLDGFNTQGENIADTGGRKLAYLAYVDWLRRNGPEKQLPGLFYTSKQMFWISDANLWCEKIRPEALKQEIVESSHSTSEFRIIGSFSNLPEFSQDFQCPLGSKMNPINKCSVW